MSNQRWTNPRLWLGLCSAGIALLFLLGDFWRTAPGPLTQVHQQAPELGGFRSCSQCHGGFTTSMTDSCLTCHEPIAEQLDVGEGLHGRLEPSLGQNCAACHSEHHGPSFAIVNRRSFERAGVADPGQFDHNLIGYEMRGRHLELTCRECHHNADLPVLPPGEHRFLGLDRNCASCHDDPHEGRMVLDCAQCHSEESFEVLEPTGHDRLLNLAGGHARTACVDCHQLGTAHELTTWGTRTHRPVRSCSACHESPHRERFGGRSANTGADRCTECHRVADQDFSTAAHRLTRAQHATTGFALDAPHGDRQCADCHLPRVRGGTLEFRARHPGRSADRCEQCHADPHGGQFDRAAQPGQVAATRCLDCHSSTAFAPHTFDSARHAALGFALTDRHAAAGCKQCHHRPEPAAARKFRGTPTACARCHADAHDGFFAQPRPAATPPGAATDADGDPADCAHCHRPTRFADAAQGFHHGAATGFALHGAHAASECTDCHHPRPSADRHGRSFGRVEEHFGEYRDCSSCHRDPHAGRFDRSDSPRAVDGRTSCARCHGDTSFRLLPHGFDHGRWTGFRLAGRHAKTECGSCHHHTDAKLDANRSLPGVAGTKCASCHADPHGGQFAAAGTTDCAKCHGDDSRGFSPDRFDHERDASFRLGQPHGGLACAACHKPYRQGGREFARYRGVPNQCADCHGGADSPFRRRSRTNRGGRR